ncbi:MAG TPA: hypothetical protein PL045_11515, partial [Chitinophagaceae bacterium]|nr:hypothetical protein [Chitinophagaceae bacterium]
TTYLVTADNEQDSISFRAQFRFAGENGTTLVLSSPGYISFDGMEVPADSSKYEGAYYEKHFHKDGFAGNHSIIYTDLNGNQHKEEFKFHKITCSEDFAAVSKKKNWVIHLSGADEADKVDVSISDTSLSNNAIELKDVQAAKPITISADQLKELKTGPLEIEIKQTKEIPLKNATQEGGTFQLFYHIKTIRTELKE